MNETCAKLSIPGLRYVTLYRTLIKADIFTYMFVCCCFVVVVFCVFVLFCFHLENYYLKPIKCMFQPFELDITRERIDYVISLNCYVLYQHLHTRYTSIRHTTA